MYQNIFVSRKDNTVYLWDDKKGLVKFPYRPYAFRKKVGGLYKSIYGDELEKIYNFSPKDPSLFESDVPLDTKILIDVYEDSDEPSVGHRIVYFDIEVSTEGGFPTVELADKEITAIALYDDATEQYTAFILDKQDLLKDYKKDNVEVRSFNNEISLLTHFLTKFEEIQPTIITGWNCDGFDTPYLYHRIKNILGDREVKRLSPIKICYKTEWNKKITIAGISCIDYMVLYKKWNIKQEASYALGAIGKKVVGMEKISYHGSLNDLYKADLNKYIEYNLNDVKIIVALEKKLQFIEQARAICHKGHVPYECFPMSSRFIEGSILMYLRRKRLVANNKPIDGDEEYKIQQEQGEEGFEGAYVKTPIPGRYDWVFDLDLTSMYPNIIISLNISPETKVGMIDTIEYDDIYLSERREELTDDYNNLSSSVKVDMSLDDYINARLYLFNTRMFTQNKILNYHIASVVYTNEQLKSLIEQSELSIASNGVLYRKPRKIISNQDNNTDNITETQELGVIPSILCSWFDERKELRKLAKKYADEKNWEMYEFYDSKQKVQKVLLNSIYGTLGLAIFRFYDKENAAAVTSTGQTIIKSTDKVIDKYFKNILGKKYKVTYDDKSTEYLYEYQLENVRCNQPPWE